MKPEYLEYRQNELATLSASLSRLPAGSYVLELGCGHGHFLTAYAEKRQKEVDNLKNADEKRPGNDFFAGMRFVGVDKNPDRIARATRKSDRAELGIHWFNARVEDVVECWPIAGGARGVAEIFVLFPDPWPKLRHQKNRFVNAALLDGLAKIARADARLYFRSDHAGYCAAVRELVRASKGWMLDEKGQFPEGLPSTIFEEYHPVFETVVASKKEGVSLGGRA